MAVRREPALSRALQDLLRLLFLAPIVAAVVVAASLPQPLEPLWLDACARVVAGLAGELLAISTLRLLLPRPELGAHFVGKSKSYARWLLSATFAEVALHPLIRAPFWFLHTTRVLYLRALGAELGFSAGFGADLVVREPSLVRVGPGALLEPGVVLEAALHGAGRVRVGQVIVGRGCLVGAHAILMPGATLGHDARIEPASLIGEDVRVGVGASIGEGARLERGVDLGSYTSVGTGAIVSEGVRVGDRARIAAGAVVPANTQIGERELWAGPPAPGV